MIELVQSSLAAQYGAALSMLRGCLEQAEGSVWQAAVGWLVSVLAHRLPRAVLRRSVSLHERAIVPPAALARGELQLPRPLPGQPHRPRRVRGGNFGTCSKSSISGKEKVSATIDD
jgi:hypothetical protein